MSIRAILAFEPVADPRAVVTAGQARFTLLTSRLIRMEFSPTGRFEDRPSQVFWRRRQAVPKFNARSHGRLLKISTASLDLDYVSGEGGFRPEGLSVYVRQTGVTWRYGQWVSPDNLGGTVRTLDKSAGPIHLEPGLVSRSGWAVVDDSHSLLFDAQGWYAPREDPGKARDLYFFGYGLDYKECLADFCRVAGPVPLLPRWALGNWWSRYWAYTQAELTALIEEFKAHDLPLSVCVIDMDWHTVETGNSSSGWTGYTWNRELFPDPKAMLRWLHRHGLKVTLNLHPAEGVHPHEERYAAMASRLGRDPQARRPVAFDLTDPDFTRAYFSILHHPLEKQGVDFWWIDWQQGRGARVAGFDPLWWLNHFHFQDSGRSARKRPLILSRWGGLGNHRYPVGFSGDTLVEWEALAFQPYFTATAANVAYDWWSHDVGGHMRGTEDEELFARWVQFGVLSPIFRLHSSKSAYLERRPWRKGRDVFHIAREMMQFRYALIPYLYTMAQRTHVRADPLVKPMYYEYPQEEQAYHCPNQYFFGSELVAAPFTAPMEADTRLSSRDVWLPPGRWFHFFSGEALTGGRWQRWYGALDDVPLFAHPGAIIPLGPQQADNRTGNPDELTVHLFPGGSRRFGLYEDDGVGAAYRRGASCCTWFSLRTNRNGLRFEIAPVEGDPGSAPPRRTYRLAFHAVGTPDRVELSINGAVLPGNPIYDAPTETLSLGPVVLSPADRLSAQLSARSGRLFAVRDRRIEKCRIRLQAFNMPTVLKDRIDRDLPAIVRDRVRLSGYARELTPGQLAALINCLDPGG